MYFDGGGTSCVYIKLGGHGRIGPLDPSLTTSKFTSRPIDLILLKQSQTCKYRCSTGCVLKRTKKGEGTEGEGRGGTGRAGEGMEKRGGQREEVGRREELRAGNILRNFHRAKNLCEHRRICRHRFPGLCTRSLGIKTRHLHITRASALRKAKYWRYAICVVEKQLRNVWNCGIQVKDGGVLQRWRIR